MKTEVYLEYLQTDFDFITYEVYCEAFDLVMSNQLTEGFFDDLKQSHLTGKLVKMFRDLKYNLSKISKEFRLGIPDLVSAFKQRDIYSMFKAFKFNIKLLFKAIGEVTKLVKGGLLEVFRKLYRTRVIQKIRSGALKVDEVLDKYPILKKVTGIVVAGLLLYIWLNMTFIGDLDYDFNFSDVAAALGGSFSLAALFVSPEGLMLLTLFGTGAVFGLSFPWLGKSLYNLTLAIVYTSYYKLKNDDVKYKEMLRKFKRKMKTVKLR
ncbi:MAG: hypothetical protein KGD64_08720 [Candidatus Heimdallarchaeota archaeon]|nr:hypothetical protein [Candidatus Heimdallarchaeota archaeon]